MTATETRPRPVATDGKPWEPLNTDGRPNLSSYSALAACGLVDAAHDLLTRDAPGTLPDPDVVIRVARGLLAMADRIQANTTGGLPDRQTGSHTRARGFLRTTLDVVGMPALDAPDEVKNAWREQVTDHATALFRGAVGMLDC